MSQLKLSYFTFPGRGEPIRIIFNIGGIKFEDDIIPEEGVQDLIKQGKFKQNQIPVLTIDGKQYAQSLSILRYAATLSGLVPKDPVLLLKTDQLTENANDLLENIIPSMYMTGETQKKNRENLVNVVFPKIFGFIEKDLQDNGSNGFGAGNSLTYGDVVLYAQVKLLTSGFYEHVPRCIADKYPAIQKVVKQVGSNKGVQQWLQKSKFYQQYK